MRRRGGSSLEHGNRQAWLLGVVAALLVALLAATIAVAIKEVTDARNAADRRAAIVASQQRTLDCIARWADTYTERSTQLAGANSERVKALDALVRSIRGSSPAGFQAALARYLAASDKLDAQLKAHPLPPSPQFLCDQLARTRSLPSPSAVTVTRTASPKPAPAVTRTGTATATRTVQVPVPGPTRTVTVPGPARTRTVTRTVAPNPRPTLPICIPGLCK